MCCFNRTCILDATEVLPVVPPVVVVVVVVVVADLVDIPDFFLDMLKRSWRCRRMSGRRQRNGRFVTVVFVDVTGFVHGNKIKASVNDNSNSNDNDKTRVTENPNIIPPGDREAHLVVANNGTMIAIIINSDTVPKSNNTPCILRRLMYSVVTMEMKNENTEVSGQTSPLPVVWTLLAGVVSCLHTYTYHVYLKNRSLKSLILYRVSKLW
jgi:hypothetical protein